MSRRDFLKFGAGILGASFASGAGIPHANAETPEDKETPESPFDPETQERVLSEVAVLMRIKFDPDKVIPIVLRAEDIPNEDYHEMYGMDTGEKRVNVFVPPDKIVLTGKSQVHNLAHEFAHYIQYTYRGNLKGTGDEEEFEAVRIQDHFR